MGSNSQWRHGTASAFRPFPFGSRIGVRRDRYVGVFCLFFLLFLSTAWAVAQDAPLIVTYGPKASTIEGDHDYREVIFFRISTSVTDRLYLRIFDADSAEDHDLVYAKADTETRYSLFGGSGAYTAWTAKAPTPSDEALEAGVLIEQRTYGTSAALNDKWHTVAAFNPSEGEKIDDHYVFKLIVQGVGGDDANLFDVGVSLRKRRNVPPAGLKIFSYSPTVRVPARRLVTEMRFSIPGDANEISVHNFDAANGKVAFATAFRTVPVAASGQDEWRESRVQIAEGEQEQVAAILFSGGREIPNDATFYVTDPTGRTIPIELPVRSWRPNNRPVPQLDVRPLADCLSVAFDASRSTDKDGDYLRYAWEFGDGERGAGRFLVHRYQDAGIYRALLKVTDSSGQIGNGAVAGTEVIVSRPPTAKAGPDILAAPGEAIAFDGSASKAGDHPIVRYLWDFNDGASAEGQTTSHSFAASGLYFVTLKVEDDSTSPCNFATDQAIVRINAPPVAEAGENLTTSVAKVVTLVGDRSYDTDGEIVSYTWDMGDGTQKSGPTVEHTYTESGTYWVSLTVRDDAGVENSTASDQLRVSVNTPPVAKAGKDRRAAIDEVIEFDATDSSDQDNYIIDYRWDFGDGSTGNGPKVSYAYRQAGTYQVKLTVRDSSGTLSSTGEDALRVLVNAPPIAEAGDDLLVTASEVQFDGTGSMDPDGSITEYLWDFGDGKTGSEPTPVHVYQSPGKYPVKLTVTDDSGTIRNRATDHAVVNVNALPIADAGVNQTGAPGQRMTFSGNGSIDPDGDVVEYHWDFGDGETASGARVSHEFSRPGTYTVRLRVHDNTGHTNAVDYDAVQVVINAPPVADGGQDVLAAPEDEVTFSAANSFDLDGEIIAYRWDFNDTVEPVEGAEITRTYSKPGIYTARLTVTDDSGALNSVAQDQITIRINHEPEASPGQDITTWNNTISFDGSNSADADGDPLTYTWDFGDDTPPQSGAKVSHTYARGGTYPVILTVDDGTGLANAKDTAAITIKINHPPVADAGPHRTVCAGDILAFDGSSSRDPEGGVLRYQWDFGDDTTAAGVNPTKLYKTGGVYPVTLTVQDDSGLPGNTRTTQIAVRVDESPIAEAGPDQTVCANAEVRFDGSGSRDFDGVVNRYSWNFGDGSTGGGETPGHIYTEPGTYRVILSIEGDDAGECDNTDSDEMTVTVIEAPVARIRGPEQVAAGGPVTFEASTSSNMVANIVSWQWDLGDGTMADGRQATHSFDEPGRYIVKLTLGTDDSTTTCNWITTKQVIVANAPPVAKAGKDQLVGINQEVLFDGSESFDQDGAIVSYEWDFGDGETATGVEVSHRFRRSGRFPVVLKVTDDTELQNNSDRDTIYITVNDAPSAIMQAPKYACTGEVIAFDGANSKDTDGEIVSYRWDFGDSSSAEGSEVSHSFTAPGRYPVTLTVDDGVAMNNSVSKAHKVVTVNQPPRAVAGPDRLVCPGSTIAFDGSGSIDWDGQLVRYKWDFGDGVSAEGKQIAHTFENPGRYQVRLWVTDNSGTSCGIAEDVAEVIVNSPPVAEAGPDRESFVGGAHDAVLFDASRSTDPDGEPLSYIWDFGDGVTETGAQALHTYTQPGQYTVRLGVVDGSGLACGETWAKLTVAVKRRD